MSDTKNNGAVKVADKALTGKPLAVATAVWIAARFAWLTCNDAAGSDGYKSAAKAHNKALKAFYGAIGGEKNLPNFIGAMDKEHNRAFPKYLAGTIAMTSDARYNKATRDAFHADNAKPAAKPAKPAAKPAAKVEPTTVEPLTGTNG
jgi:hypothetical protein